MSEPVPLTVATMPAERAKTARIHGFDARASAFTVALTATGGAGLPKDVPALERTPRGAPTFAPCRAQRARFWHAQARGRDSAHLTSRRGLRLPLPLVFFALIFGFPLRVVHAGLANAASGGVLPRDDGLHPGHGPRSHRSRGAEPRHPGPVRRLRPPPRLHGRHAGGPALARRPRHERVGFGLLALVVPARIAWTTPSRGSAMSCCS